MVEVLGLSQPAVSHLLDRRGHAGDAAPLTVEAQGAADPLAGGGQAAVRTMAT